MAGWSDRASVNELVRCLQARYDQGKVTGVARRFEAKVLLMREVQSVTSCLILVYFIVGPTKAASS